MVVASPFFRDMFSLPDSPGTNVYQEGKPVIDMQEMSLTLDNLLRFCYPIENPKISDRKTFQNVMAAADKFGMEFLFEAILGSYITHATVSPMERYGIARRFGISQLAKDSMRSCLDYSLPELIDQAQDTDLTYLSARDYDRVFQYYRAYSRRCEELVDGSDITWFDAGKYAFASNDCREYHDEPGVTLEMAGDYGLFDIVVPRKKWWFDHMERIRSSIAAKGPKKAVEEIDVHQAAVDVIASGCSMCQKAAIEELHEFSAILAKCVKDCMDGVRLCFHYLAAPLTEVGYRLDLT